jgi:hypothetical protein
MNDIPHAITAFPQTAIPPATRGFIVHLDLILSTDIGHPEVDQPHRLHLDKEHTEERTVAASPLSGPPDIEVESTLTATQIAT